MLNRLALETSPYLLQHAENPVDWYPWGPDALTKAREENKPIFLSIGYAACHWCHVMAHESFEDPQIAQLLNTKFVPVKVDREERPDLDSIYMNAVVAMTGQGGWPMSVFLTADGKPFYGGTYFPPSPRHGMPSFRQVLEGITNAWENDRGQVDQVGSKLADSMRESALWNWDEKEIDPNTLQAAVDGLLRQYDWENGGWGGPPKFPQPMLIEFLLRQAARDHKDSVQAAFHALDVMSRGGLYDVVGGGFHRYSTDAAWLVPHFEKMLYDNAQLALAYLHAYLVTEDARYRQICMETLDFIQREMTHPQGGFYSSLDADSEGEEGKYYTWSHAELREVLTQEEFSTLEKAYRLPESGNFEGSIILQRVQSDADLARDGEVSPPEMRDQLRSIHMRLLERRGQRVRPGTDDKILVSWNALALQAFAEAARYLDHAGYRETALKNAGFLLEALRPDGRLMRAWRDQRAQQPAFLEDFAALSIALLHLYQTDPDPRWFSAARELIGEMQARFTDPSGGFFDTPEDSDDLLLRPKELQDNATPSGSALAAHSLSLFAAFEGDHQLKAKPESMLSTLQEVMVRYPTAFGYWLNALDFSLGPIQQIAVVGPMGDNATRALLDAIFSRFRPRAVVAMTEGVQPDGSPSLLEDRLQISEQPTAYVCEGFVCRQPVTSAEALIEQLV